MDKKGLLPKSPFFMFRQVVSYPYLSSCDCFLKSAKVILFLSRFIPVNGLGLFFLFLFLVSSGIPTCQPIWISLLTSLLGSSSPCMFDTLRGVTFPPLVRCLFAWRVFFFIGFFYRMSSSSCHEYQK